VNVFGPLGKPPESPPKINLAQLWVSLLMPPLVAGIGTPFFLIGNIGVTALVFVIGMAVFLDCMSERFRGRSLTLLGFGYLVGQLVICTAVGAGACLLMFAS